MKRAASLILALVLLTGFSAATVTSADSITYNSNSDFFDGTVFAISIASDQATDKIDVHLDKDRLSQSVEGDVQQDLTIDVTSQNNHLRYSTTPSSDFRAIRTVVPYHDEGFSSEEEARQAIADQCYDLNGDGRGSGHGAWRADSWSWEIWCFQRSKYLGTPAYLDNPEEHFQTRFEIQADGKTVQSATLSNGETGEGVSTDLGRHAKVRWNGNLDTGAAQPNVGRVYALHANRYSGSWRIISQQGYSDYKYYLENSAHDTLQDWAAGSNTGWQAAEWLNDRAWSAAEVATSSDLAYTTVADSSFNSGAFTYDTEDLLVYPMFTVYVNAGENGYIEISKPVGTPRIVSTSSTKIEELSTGTISTVVRNVGDGEGSFSARVTGCSNGFTFSDSQRTKTVQKGQTVSYNFDISFQSTSREQKEISGSCTVRVEDTGSNQADSTTIDVTGVQASQCEAGTQSVKVNSEGLYEIYECKENEQGKKLVKTCDEGEKAVAQGDDTFACQENPDPPCEDGDCPPPPTPWWQKLINFLTGGSGTGGLLDQIHLGLSLLAGALASVAGYKGSRWIDGEYQVQGSFEPFKGRSIDRVSRGRFIVGVVGAILGFTAGTLMALQIALIVQVIVIIGIAALLYYKPW